MDRRNASLSGLNAQVDRAGDTLEVTRNRIDSALNTTLLRPLNETVRAVERIQDRVIDNMGHRNVLLMCLFNPRCCGNPKECLG